MGGLRYKKNLNFLALGGDLHQALGNEGIGGHGTQVLALAGTDGNGAVLHIPVADDQHIGDLLHLSFPDLVAQLLAAAVGLGVDVQSVQLVAQVLGILVGTVGDGQYLDQVGIIHRGRAPA